MPKPTASMTAAASTADSPAAGNSGAPHHRAAPARSARYSLLACGLALAGLGLAGQAAAQVTFYEHDGFGGRAYTATQALPDFTRIGFNDQASSVVVARDRWEVCQDAGYGGSCVVLRPGRYASLGAMGLNDKVSSARRLASNDRVDDDRYGPQPVLAPDPVDTRDYRRRGGERLYRADVSEVRAVLATPQQRCWVEPGQVNNERSGANVPGAIVGGLLGGILGHQVGGGVGRDLATVGGLAAGAAVGANVGRDRNGQRSADVQRCADVPGQARTEYWNVTYNFRGQQHQVQMTHPPGATITVNRQGEPRT